MEASLILNNQVPVKYGRTFLEVLSEALIFASTNTQYDDRLFIELQVQYMKIPRSNLGRTCSVQKLFDIQSNFCTPHVLPMFAERRAFHKDLPVL